MKLLLTVALATMMTSVTYAAPHEKSPGRDKGRERVESRKDAQKAYGTKDSQSQQKDMGEANRITEEFVSKLKSIETSKGVKFDSYSDLKYETLTVGYGAMRAQSSEKLVSADEFYKTLGESLEFINDKESFNSDQAAKINQLFDNVQKALDSAVSTSKSEEVLADLVLVQSLIGQTKAMFSDKEGKRVAEASPDYMKMIESLLALSEGKLTTAGEVRQAMGEKLYSDAKKACLLMA